jgi:hypothetical protein
MQDDQRIEAVRKTIRSNDDLLLIGKLESLKDFKSEAEFQNYLLILLVLIEESAARESAATLLWLKIYTDKMFKGDKSEDQYGRYILNFLDSNALSPYVHLSYFVSRLIATIIYDIAKNETAHISRITDKSQLLTLNESLLEKHIREFPFSDETMTMFYHCVENIDPNTNRITLGKRACQLVYNKIMSGNFEAYLALFLRPYYTSMSSNWMPEARYHVPEPFFSQIFQGADNFTNLVMKHTNQLQSKNLANDIVSFMGRYSLSSLKGLEYVDIAGLNLSNQIHRHLRALV